MSFTTVGELIDALSKINRATPILKEDITGPGYTNIETGAAMLFKVVPTGIKFGHDYYIDADQNNPDSFDAVVL